METLAWSLNALSTLAIKFSVNLAWSLISIIEVLVSTLTLIHGTNRFLLPTTLSDTLWLGSLLVLEDHGEESLMVSPVTRIFYDWCFNWREGQTPNCVVIFVIAFNGSATSLRLDPWTMWNCFTLFTALAKVTQGPCVVVFWTSYLPNWPGHLSLCQDHISRWISGFAWRDSAMQSCWLQSVEHLVLIWHFLPFSKNNPKQTTTEPLTFFGFCWTYVRVVPWLHAHCALGAGDGCVLFSAPWSHRSQLCFWQHSRWTTAEIIWELQGMVWGSACFWQKWHCFSLQPVFSCFYQKKVWCPNMWNPGVPDRCAKKLFTAAIIRPGGGSQYPSVSQKIMSATACRYLIFWLSNFLMQCNWDNVLYTFFDWHLFMF